MPNLNRRNFLLGGAAAGAFTVLPKRVFGANARPTVALIGCGRQALCVLVPEFRNLDVDIVIACDCDKARREGFAADLNKFYEARGRGKICRPVADFRDVVTDPSVDMVVVATPDHWHAYITVEAMRNGKDVYCEKPLTYNVFEANMVKAASAKYGRIVQTGAMQRSTYEFVTACEIVRNGFIGTVKYVDCTFGGPSRPHRLWEKAANAAEEGAPNPDIDWDMWLGPAPWTPYSDKLSPRGICPTYPMFWRFDDYFGLGSCGDFGAHHLDIAQWGLGRDGSGPVKVIRSEASYSSDPLNGFRRQSGTQFVYDDGVVLRHCPSGEFTTVFYGTDGIVAVGRNRFAMWLGKGVVPDDKTRKQISDGDFDGMKRLGFYNVNQWKLKNLASYIVSSANDGSKEEAIKKTLTALGGSDSFLTKLYRTPNARHTDDFVACFKSRQQPCSNAVVGAGSSILCSLLNMSYVYDTGFDWDPAKGAFARGTGNPDWLARGTVRNGWSIKV